jgi:hypothetical protein
MNESLIEQSEAEVGVGQALANATGDGNSLTKIIENKISAK